jgi:ABC-type sugar transport system ATPase subunit
MQFHSPTDAIRSGLAMVQEDRKTLSLFIGLPVLLNISIAQLPNFSKFGVINNRSLASIARNYVLKLNIKLGSINSPVSSLSGGNQQKTILARWLATNPELLILDEPTHGVDVGAKSDIYNLMRSLAEQGISIMLISSELPEILAMSDRVVVMHEGKVTGILDRDNLDEHTIMLYATGLASRNGEHPAESVETQPASD